MTVLHGFKTSGRSFQNSLTKVSFGKAILLPKPAKSKAFRTAHPVVLLFFHPSLFLSDVGTVLRFSVVGTASFDSG